MKTNKIANMKGQSEIVDLHQDLFCVANKWKNVLIERSLIANKRSKWSKVSEGLKWVKGYKGCNLRSKGFEK